MGMMMRMGATILCWITTSTAADGTFFSYSSLYGSDSCKILGSIGVLFRCFYGWRYPPGSYSSFDSSDSCGDTVEYWRVYHGGCFLPLEIPPRRQEAVLVDHRIVVSFQVVRFLQGERIVIQRSLQIIGLSRCETVAFVSRELIQWRFRCVYGRLCKRIQKM